MGKIAIVTQSYKNDFNECRLLCESIDRFASQIDHFIFVNDEDIRLFKVLNYGRHKVFKKSTIMPRFFIRIPFKLLGHHFYVSPFTIPVREWILQQICKLGVFEVIGADYDAIFHIDSETVFMKPFVVSEWKKDGKYIMFRIPNIDEPSHDDYVKSAKKLLGLPQSIAEIGFWNYMNIPTCFVRENTEKLLERIRRVSKFKNWKLALCNTYRFSEYYTYGIYTNIVMGMKNHFPIDYKIFPIIDITACHTKEELSTMITEALKGKHVLGVLLNKRDRKHLSDQYIDFNLSKSVIKEYWKNLNNTTF